jgi:hypothetical protein
MYSLAPPCFTSFVYDRYIYHSTPPVEILEWFRLTARSEEYTVGGKNSPTAAEAAGRSTKDHLLHKPSPPAKQKLLRFPPPENFSIGPSSRIAVLFIGIHKRYP